MHSVPLLSGASGVEQLAAEAAERSLQLRGLTDKGARLRKKKALGDLLKALQGQGLSRRRSAVPVQDRTVQDWFLQARKQHQLQSKTLQRSCVNLRKCCCAATVHVKFAVLTQACSTLVPHCTDAYSTLQGSVVNQHIKLEVSAAVVL